ALRARALTRAPSARARSGRRRVPSTLGDGERARRVEADRLRLALEGDRLALVEVADVPRSDPQRRLRDQHVVSRLAGRRLDAGGGVDGVADDGGVEAPSAADRPAHNRSGVDPDPDSQVAAESLALGAGARAR